MTLSPGTRLGPYEILSAIGAGGMGTRTWLHAASQIMADKVVSGPRAAVGRTVGRCDDGEIGAVDDALRRWLALG